MKLLLLSGCLDNIKENALRLFHDFSLERLVSINHSRGGLLSLGWLICRGQRLAKTFVLGRTLMLGYGGAIVNETICAVTESPVTTSSAPIPIFVVELFNLGSIGRCLMFPRRNYVVGSMVFFVLFL